MKYIQTLTEKEKLKWQDSDAPDANGRFRDLSPKDLAAWLIKTRKGDMKKISGSLSQQVAFNKNDDPEYAKKMDKTRIEVYKQMDREDLLESINEGKMPNKYIGNDEIVFLKTKEDSRSAHYNLYYKGHDIDKGGHRFGSEKELEDFASNYILSNQLYRKLRYEDSIPLPESVDMDDLENAKERLSNPHTILDITYDKTRRGDKFVRLDYENKYVPGKMLDSGPHFVNVRYDNNKDLKKISKELNMDLKESVLNEEDTWNDYPAAAKKNAQMAIDWKEKYGRDEVDAGTPVGWARAHQLAKGENLSTDTVKRMSAFNRHRKNSSIKPELKETPWKDRGYVAWLIWGGDEGVDWAIEKSKEIDAMKESKQMKYIKPLSERAKHKSTDFSKPGNDGDIYFSKREGDAVGIKLGDKLQMIYVFQKEPKLGRIQKSDKRWENMGPASEELLIDLRGREDGRILFDFVSTLEESVDEVKRSMISGTSGRTVSSLEYRKYELKKDVKDAKIGDFINVTLPKGTIIYNLPGGVFADHFALKQRYASRSSRGPQYFDKPTFKGIQIISKHDTLTAIEKNSKVLESVVNEGYWSHHEYDKWTKENGKPKYPKWVKTTLKEIIKGGFMEPVYDAEHNYMVLWLASLENKRRSELYAYDSKGKKEFGKVGYAMYQRFYNDLTSYNMFFMQGALYAMEVSKQIQDRIANGEPVEPAYYMMKEYFNNFGMDTKRSRVFNAAYEKLEKWMKDNQIETL